MAGMSLLAAQAALDAIVALVDDTSPSVLRIYDGTPPALCDDALSGNTLLVEFAVGAFDATSNDGAPNAVSPSSASFPLTQAAVATGTASFFRLISNGGAGTPHVQGTCGTAADSDLVFNSVEFVSGTDVILSSFNLIMSEAG